MGRFTEEGRAQFVEECRKIVTMIARLDGLNLFKEEISVGHALRSVRRIVEAPDAIPELRE